MKNNKKFAALIALALLTTTACKDYLEVAPISQFDNKAVFSDVPNATLAVLGAYDALSGNSTYGIRLSLYYPYDSDEGMCSGALDNGRRGIARYDLRSGNTEIIAPFNQLYQGIERANICIEQIPLMDKYTTGTASEQADLKRLQGEVLTLRAQYLFELIRTWGDVPSPLVPAYQQKDLFLGKDDRDGIYDKLLEDLKTAATLVPWRKEVTTNNERITKGAVKGLRARLALYRGGYSLRRESKQMERRADYLTYYKIARDECADIMARRDQHTLNASFEDLFKKYVCSLTADPAGEVMFEASMSGGDAVSDSQLGNYDGPKCDPSCRYGRAIAGVNTLPTYFYAFDSTDTRRDVSITPYSIGATNLKAAAAANVLTTGKFRRDWRVPNVPGVSQFIGINWPILRFSDILLMFAEADNELTTAPSADAIKAFEEVRKRAYKGNETKIGTTPTTKAAFFTAITNERLLEFGNEGIRKWDLIRWNQLSTAITKARADMTDMMNGGGKYATYPQYMYWQNNGEEIVWYDSFYKPGPSTTPTGWNRINWRKGLTATYIASLAQYFTANKNELFPINQGAIDVNPNLKQDYGY